jgi:hypothetical protein
MCSYYSSPRDPSNDEKDVLNEEQNIFFFIQDTFLVFEWRKDVFLVFGKNQEDVLQAFEEKKSQKKKMYKTYFWINLLIKHVLCGHTLLIMYVCMYLYTYVCMYVWKQNESFV